MPGKQKQQKRSSNVARRSGPVALPPLESPPDVEPRVYSLSDLKRLVDLPETLLQQLENAGHLRPVRTGRKVSYTFEDLVVLHAASGLRSAAIPVNKIVDALTKLRQALPQGAALTALAKGPIESEVSSTEQLFLVDHRTPNPTRLKRQQAAEQRLQRAEQHFAEALAVEETDIAAARAGYLTALSVHSGHLEARINLGRLLHLNGELAAAEKVYREAKHASALLSFNLAALLEDLDREEEAILSYREALALDPTLHDAHYNLSRLHEKAERPREALQHLLAYRRFGRVLNEE